MKPGFLGEVNKVVRQLSDGWLQSVAIHPVMTVTTRFILQERIDTLTALCFASQNLPESSSEQNI
jgi:hypothetical protein